MSQTVIQADMFKGQWHHNEESDDDEGWITDPAKEPR